MTDQHDTNDCGLYGRVSTDRQARMQEGGLDTQFNQMERRVEYENGNGQDKEWRIVERYREEGWSGKNLERPEFRRMMQDIKSRRINTVIVYKIDRITRSLSDFLELWKVFEEYNVEFISLHEKFDTTTAVGRAMLKLILVFAELEREQTSERTKATMRHRAEQGLDNGRAKILGYDRDPNQKGILFVNEEEARLAREHVFEKLIELGSAGAVTRHLRQAGIRKPQYTTRRENTRGGGPYQKQEVIRMLTDVVYRGQVKYDGEAFEGRHEAIVDQDLFDRAQAILERNRITRNSDRNGRNHVYLLRSLIRCGRCGAMMTPKHSQGRKAVRSYYYACSRQNHSAGEACNANYIPADAAEEYVLDEIRRLATDSDLIAETVSQANGNRDGQLERMGTERRSLPRRLQDVQNRISRVMTAIETEPDLGTLGERLAELEAEKAAMEEELDGLDEEMEVTRLAAISAKRMIASCRTLPQVLDGLQKEGDRYAIRELLGRLIEVIEWTQDEDDPSRGTVEIMLFEQQLSAGEEVTSAKETRDDPLVTSGCVTSNGRLPVQVPRRSRNGQKRLCISHDYHTVRVDYAPVLKVGKPPEEQPKTARRLRTRVRKGEVVNAVKVARKYQKFLERPEVLGYQQAAKKFGVSKPVISTYLAILNRLPTSFVEWLENCPDKLVVAFFSERRLRPVTRIEGDQEKVNVLRALLNQCLGELEEENQALERLRVLLETEVPPSDSEDSSYPPPRAFRAIQLD